MCGCRAEDVDEEQRLGFLDAFDFNGDGALSLAEFASLLRFLVMMSFLGSGGGGGGGSFGGGSLGDSDASRGSDFMLLARPESPPMARFSTSHGGPLLPSVEVELCDDDDDDDGSSLGGGASLDGLAAPLLDSSSRPSSGGGGGSGGGGAGTVSINKDARPSTPLGLFDRPHDTDGYWAASSSGGGGASAGAVVSVGADPEAELEAFRAALAASAQGDGHGNDDDDDDDDGSVASAGGRTVGGSTLGTLAPGAARPRVKFAKARASKPDKLLPSGGPSAEALAPLPEPTDREVLFWRPKTPNVYDGPSFVSEEDDLNDGKGEINEKRINVHDPADTRVCPSLNPSVTPHPPPPRARVFTIPVIDKLPLAPCIVASPPYRLYVTVRLRRGPRADTRRRRGSVQSLWLQRAAAWLGPGALLAGQGLVQA